MKVFPWSFYTKECNGTTIMACYVEEGDSAVWEIYYKRPKCPFMFAFGLAPVHKIDDVFSIAGAGIPEYENLFN